MQKLLIGVCTLCILVQVVACASGEETASISGLVVLRADSSPVSGVTITSSAARQQIVSNADGTFQLGKIKSGTRVVFTAQAPGYAPVTKYIEAVSGAPNKLQFFLQPSETTTITLPNAGEPAVATTAGNPNGGTATLSIPPGSLITADGTIATGSAEVTMTYWDPASGRLYGPLPLLATGLNANDAPRSLTTRGMADVKVVQNGQELKVAPGQHVDLSFFIPPALQPLVSANLYAKTDVPHLFSGDANQGLWIEEGSLETGNLTFDSNTFSFVGALSHMSAWNLDVLNYNVGGCVQGQVVDSNLKPVAGANVRIWLLSVDEVADYLPASTDENGNYCMNIGTNGGTGSEAYQVNYYISSASDPEASNMCDPMPSFCKYRQYEDYIYEAQHNWVQECAMRNDAVCDDTRNGAISGTQGGSGQDAFCSPRPPCNKGTDTGTLMSQCSFYEVGGFGPRYAYADACTPSSPLVAIEACHFCPGTVPSGNCSGQSTKTPFTSFSQAPVEGGCGVLKTITFIPGDVTPDPPPVGTTVPLVCQANSPTTKHLGDACVPGTDTCCPVADGLVCQDLVCVPPKDG